MKSARASCYPARICGSHRAIDPAQNGGLTSKPAQERSQDTLFRKRSREQGITARSDEGYDHPQGYDPAGPRADQGTKALEIPGLRSQEDWYATGAALIVGIGISGNDGVSSLAQVTSATTASKNGTRRGTDNITAPTLAPKRKKRQASSIPEQGEALQVNKTYSAASACSAASAQQAAETSHVASTHGEVWEDGTFPETSRWTHNHPLPNNPSS
jgi:hypothetical protein